MKKITLIFAAMLIVLAATSQTEKGKMQLGAALNIDNSSQSNADNSYKSDDNNFAFRFSPNFEYFLKENLSVGLKVNFNFFNNQTNYNSGQNTSRIINSTSYSIGVFGKKYSKISDKLYLTLYGGVNYSYSVEKIKMTTSDTNYIFSQYNPAKQEIQRNSMSFSIVPGLTYFLTPKLGISTSFGSLYYTYNISENKSLPFENHDNYQNLGLNLNMSSFNFGISYHF
ncbi:MAG: outer membrane beta-barrel protein [Bacteroidota bacterium]